MKQREGTFFDETEMSMIIDEDADVYGHDDNGDKKLLFKFRKNLLYVFWKRINVVKVSQSYTFSLLIQLVDRCKQVSVGASPANDQ